MPIKYTHRRRDKLTAEDIGKITDLMEHALYKGRTVTIPEDAIASILFDVRQARALLLEAVPEVVEK